MWSRGHCTSSLQMFVKLRMQSMMHDTIFCHHVWVLILLLRWNYLWSDILSIFKLFRYYLTFEHFDTWLYEIWLGERKNVFWSYSGESRSVQVKLSGDRHYYEAKELNENVKYIFSVRAQTSVGWGPPRFGNITTGPQKGEWTKI